AWGAGLAFWAAAPGTMPRIAIADAPAAMRRATCAGRINPPLVNEADIAFPTALPTRSATDPARTMVKYGKYFLVTALGGSTGRCLAVGQFEDNGPGARQECRPANLGKGLGKVEKPFPP